MDTKSWNEINEMIARVVPPEHRVSRILRIQPGTPTRVAPGDDPDAKALLGWNNETRSFEFSETDAVPFSYMLKYQSGFNAWEILLEFDSEEVSRWIQGN